jgi:hypothetical protein
MATSYKDFRKATEDVLHESFPLDDDKNPQNSLKVSLKATTAAGVAVKSTFQQTRSGDVETSKSTAELSHECKEHGRGFKGTFDTNNKTVGASLWANNLAAKGTKAQFDAEVKTGKSGTEFKLSLPISFKNENANVSVKPTYTVHDGKFSAEVNLAGARNAVSFGVGTKLSLAGLGDSSLALAYNGSDFTFVGGVDKKTGYRAKFSWYHKLAFKDVKYGICACAPIPGYGEGDACVKAAGSFKPNADTTLAAHIDRHANLGLSATVRVNDNFTVAGSTYFQVSNFAASCKDRVVGISVELSD